MSVAEIIEQIKALPREDFREVAKFIDSVRQDAGAEASASDAVRPGFHEAAAQVFDRYDGLFRELAK